MECEGNGKECRMEERGGKEEEEEEKDEEEDDDDNEGEAWRGARGAVGAARAVGFGGSAASVDTARRRHRHVRKGAETEGKAGPGQDTTGHGASGGGGGILRAAAVAHGAWGH